MSTQGHIRRRGANSWELKFDAGRDEVTGKRLTRFHSFRGTRAEAKIKLAELVVAVGKGSYVEKSKTTVADHVRARIDQWEAAGKIGAKTAERYRELLANQIVPFIGPITIQKLKPIDVERWHNDLRTKGRKDGKGGLKPLTIRHAHRLVSKALKDAVRFDLVTKNAAVAQGAPSIDEDDEVVILKRERVNEVIGKLRDRPIYPAAMVALFTGIRRGELLALRWRSVDLDGKKEMKVQEALEETKAHGLRVKKPKTKSGIRPISLPDIVLDALREHRRRQLELRVALGLGRLPDDALVFPADGGGHRSPRSFSSYWADQAAAIGAPDVTLHALRHTHASQLIEAGIDVVTISKRLGHSNPTITLRIYAHSFRDRDDKATDAINSALAGFGKV